MTTQAIAPLKPTVVEHAQPSLLEEILEETKLRGSLGMFDLDRAAEQAEQRVKALKMLQHAAISSTKPIHWQLFRNEQGQIFARFNHAGAERIAFVFGITVSPKGPVQFTDTHGKRRTAEVFGTATSVVLGVTIDNIRSYRVEGEDFLGRPMVDVPPRDGKGKTRIGVGDNDWIQSTMTGLISKGVRLLSGLVTASVDELAEVWGMEPGEVEKKCTMGHGFSRAEREEAGQSTGAGVPISEPQAKRMFGMASGRLKALGHKGSAGDVVTACIGRIMGAKATGEVFAPEEVTRDAYERICGMIEKWEPTTNGDNPKAPATAPDPEATAPQGELATVGQKKMLQDKANAKAKALPAGAGVDGGAILHECIMEVCGSDKVIDDVAQDQLAAVVGKIGAWGAAK